MITLIYLLFFAFIYLKRFIITRRIVYSSVELNHKTTIYTFFSTLSINILFCITIYFEKIVGLNETIAYLPIF